MEMDKRNIAVIFGGQSTEHEVSCMSVVNVASNIDTDKWEVILIGITKEGRWLLAESLDSVKDGSWRESEVTAEISPDAVRKSVLITTPDGKAMGVELESDMLTIKTPIRFIAKSQHCSAGTGYEGHEFFEASSMRKFNGRYYFIYSSVNGHELCYAMGDSPLGEFRYAGVLVSIGDVGLSARPLNYLGNTHGSVEYINGQYYVFYHRQTNRHCYSRQACAERIQMNADGTFSQAEITSCGLNGGPLKAEGEYEARIACNLYSGKGVRFYTIKMPAGCHPYFTQSGVDREENGDQYIANFCNGATAGFKYFTFSQNERIGVRLRGSASGKITVTDGDGVVAEIAVSPSSEPRAFFAPLKIAQGVKPLYFTFRGRGRADFLAILF